MEKLKLLFVAASFGGGGAERVMLNILKNVDRNKYDIQLCLIRKSGIFLKEIPKDIQIYYLNKQRTSLSLIRLVRIIQISHPDIILSNMLHVNILTILAKTINNRFSSKLIIRETIIPSYTLRKSLKMILLGYIIRIFYNLSSVNGIIAQCHYMKNDLVKKFRIKHDKLFIINNPADYNDIRVKTKIVCNYPVNPGVINLVSVARLERIKGHDLLLKIVDKLQRGRYHLHILGEGSMHNEIKNNIKNMKLSKHVTIHGFVQNPYPLISQMDMFLLTSRSDPYPNSVIEALVLGIPVIAFNSPGGISEMIDSGVNGELVKKNDVEEFRRNIEAYTKDKYNDSNISETSKKKYGRTIIDQYHQLFENIQ